MTFGKEAEAGQKLYILFRIEENREAQLVCK